MIMITQQPKDVTKRSCEASTRSLWIKELTSSLQRNESLLEGFPESNAGPDGDIVEAADPSEFIDLSNAFQVQNRISSQHKFGTLAAFYLMDPFRMHWCQRNAYQSQRYPFFINTQFETASYTMFPQGYPYDFQFQDFQYFVVIDFEATCDKDKILHPQEIIEFPSVIVNSMTRQLEGYFQTYVRPTYNQQLTDFCKDLTGIQQNQVDRGVSLSEALLAHDIWLENMGIKHTKFAVVTWSNWDCRVILESECRYKKIQKPSYFDQWINLRVPFHKTFGDVRCNLKEAVELAGLTWQGRAHCGLDDAKNTARLLTILMHRGCKLSITNSLTSQSVGHLRAPTLLPDHPRAPTQLPEHPISPPHHPHRPRILCTAHCQLYDASKGMMRKPGPK